MLARFIVALSLTLLGVAAPAGAAVSVGHSGWFWGTPTPQGNDLLAVEFAGTTGYATGGFGTLLATTDGGGSWAGLRSGMTADLRKIEVIDGNSLIFASACAVRRSDDAGATLRRLPFTTSEDRCTQRLEDLSFANESVGYLVLQNGTVLRTADNGESFALRTPIPGTRQAGGPARPTAIEFATVDVGFATTSAGRLFRTVNGGGSWTEEFTSPNALNGLFIASATTAVVVGDNSMYAVSNDGGDTWTRTLESPTYAIPADFTSVRCSSTGVCLMTTRGGQVVRTDDGGKTFQITEATGVAIDISAARAVAVGGFGRTFVSSDSGRTWDTVGRTLDAVGLGDLVATSRTVAHVPGNKGDLARTVDGGETWRNVGVATSEDVRDVSFPSSLVGYALDVTGGVFRTRNGGDDWTPLDTGTSAEPRAVLAPSATVVLLVGPRGVRRSGDAGGSFRGISDKDVRRKLLADADKAGKAVVAFGSKALAMSTNGGKAWRGVKRPSKKRAIDDVDFVSPKVGYVLLADGGVYVTRNGGRRWRESLGVGTEGGTQVAFANAKSGWLAIDGFAIGGGGHVLRTSDGGLTWRPQLLGPGPVGSIAAGTGKAAFARLIHPRPELLATRTGGDIARPARVELSATTRKVKGARIVTLRGRLRGARGGERVVVSFRALAAKRWAHKIARAAGNGKFRFQSRITKTNVFVAQWRGDEETAAGASRAVTVRAGRR